MTRAALLLLSVVLLALSLEPAGDAVAQKRGGGTGGGGGHKSESSRPRTDDPAPTTPGGYGFSGAAVQEAFQRGEGRQALAAYERAAAVGGAGPGDGHALQQRRAGVALRARRRPG